MSVTAPGNRVAAQSHEYQRGDVRTCRNCDQPIYFGYNYWWHKHTESTFCSGSGDSRAVPDLDEVERVRAAAPELLKALKACHLQMLQSNNDSEYAEEANRMAIAAIAKAEGR